MVSGGLGQQLYILGEAHDILQFSAGHRISWVGSCLEKSESRCCLVILGMACVILLSTVSLQGRGYSRHSLVQLNIQVVHSASVDDSEFARNLYCRNTPPQAALPPGRDRASRGISSSVLRGTSAAWCGLYFGFVIWVNGSILLTDGSLPGTPEKSGFQTSEAGGQRLGNAPR